MIMAYSIKATGAAFLVVLTAGAQIIRVVCSCDTREAAERLISDLAAWGALG